jgi:hypothetical protein
MSIALTIINIPTHNRNRYKKSKTINKSFSIRKQNLHQKIILEILSTDSKKLKTKMNNKMNNKANKNHDFRTTAKKDR